MEGRLAVLEKEDRIEQVRRSWKAEAGVTNVAGRPESAVTGGLPGSCLCDDPKLLRVLFFMLRGYGSSDFHLAPLRRGFLFYQNWWGGAVFGPFAGNSLGLGAPFLGRCLSQRVWR